MKKLAFTFLTLSLATASAQIADYSIVPSITSDRFTVNADASYDEVYEVMRIIRDQADVQNRTVIATQFIAGLQSAEAVEAYVLKVDGTKIAVGKNQITVKDAPGANGFADFGDNKILQVLFPNVGVGDKLYAKLHVKSKAIFPGRFSTFTEDVPYGYPYQSIVIVDAPKSLNLVGKARGAVKLTQQDKGERVVFTLADGNDKYRPGEPGAECPCDYAGAASVSNFKDWGDLARAYRDRAADKVTVTPEISDLAKKLVGDKKGLDAVKAVDTWVRSNIRYVQVYLDAGGYVPHSAASILKNKYGDCKDYVTLTQTMLKAVGIESEPALVGTMPRYLEIPVSGPEQFDHAILFVPGLNLYLDPTNRFAPVGAYQDVLEGKPVLNTTTGVLKTFPVTPAATNSLEQLTNLTLSADGTVKGEMELKSTGTMTSTIRNAFSGVTPEQYTQVVQGMMSSRDEPGTGSLALAPEFSDGGGVDVRATWTSPKLVTVDDVTSLKMPNGLTVIPFSNFLGSVSRETRFTPYVAGASQVHKLVTLTLPDTLKVTRLPKDAQGENAAFRYSVTYRQEGQKIISDQLLVFKQDIVQPADYPAYREALQAAVKAAGATILLEKK